MAPTDPVPLGRPDELSDDQREAVETLLFRLADDEFVLAERYTEWQVVAPTLESDLALSNVAQDELGHARLWYDLLEEFGYGETELVWERRPDEWHHATLTELPFAEGDWADAVVRSYCYDVAEELRLDALVGSSYPRIGDRVGKIQGEERFHREHAENWLERLATDPDGLERVQSAVDRLFPHALTLFEPVDVEREARIDDLGLRTESPAAMREEWLDQVLEFFESLELRVEDPHRVELPDAVGRDGSHTDHWRDLHEDVTSTYRELGRTSVRRIMADPDDA
jgi:ring-1,2-phenylacetyl-CoA epoxidase subunit PaaC